MIWKTLLPLTLGVLLVLAYKGSPTPVIQISNARFCIPPEAVITHSGTLPRRSVNRDLDVDSSDGHVMFRISGEEIEEVAPGFVHYAARKRRGEEIPPSENPYQPLLVSVREHLSLQNLANYIRRKDSPYQPITLVPDDRTGLHRLHEQRRNRNTKVDSWHFVHVDATGELDFDSPDWNWGYCDTYNKPDPTDYDCIRELRRDGLWIQYSLRGENTPHYKAIDRLVLEKLEAWRCD